MQVGDPVINLGFPLGDAPAFGIEALLDEGSDSGFVGVGCWRDGYLAKILPER
jgi:hypothetical protein